MTIIEAAEKLMSEWWTNIPHCKSEACYVCRNNDALKKEIQQVIAYAKAESLNKPGEPCQVCIAKDETIHSLEQRLEPLIEKIHDAIEILTS